MSALTLGRMRHLHGGAVMLLMGVGIALPAQGRGAIADMDPPTIITGCALGPGCSPQSDFAGTPFSNVYAYADGVVSFGNPLTSPVQGDLSTFGSSYIAAGLADYASLGLAMSVQYKYLPGNFAGPKLELFWDFTSVDTAGVPPNSEDALFAIYLISQPGGTFHADVAFGTGNFTWFNSSTTPTNGATPYNPYCDAVCVANTGSFNNVYGVYLPDGALFGSSYAGTVTETDADGSATTLAAPYDGSPITVDKNFSYANYAFDFTPPPGTTTSVGVPESGTSFIMAFGLGAMGAAMVWSRRRRVIVKV